MSTQIQNNKHVDEFRFLYDLINEFTKKLDIDSKLFYFMVQRKIRGMTLLQGFVYQKDGLSSHKELFKTYKKGKEIYAVAPYLASFSRLLSYVYHKAVDAVGEEKAETLLEESFNVVKKRYDIEPNLEGYIPREATGKAAAAAAAAAAFDVSLMDNMLIYMLNDVIKKGITPVQRKIKEARSALSPEEKRNAVRDIYVAGLGPLGRKQYEKVGETLDFRVIQDQMNNFRRRNIINKERAELILESAGGVLGVKGANEEEVDLKGESLGKKRLKK